MVSVLIPVYGESVDAQLASLAIEAKKLDYPVEIIICDDASDNPVKPSFTDYEGIEFRYIELKQNIGRSKIRNYLASEAKYNQLIFVDADCLPIQSHFIHTYKLLFNKDVVLVGGQLFAAEQPISADFTLRWKYGTQVEARSLKDRQKSPFKSFMANNFSISKEMLEEFHFDLNHSGYGHEDTLFGYQLRRNNITVTHVKNPIRHLGQETNTQFLNKTIEGVKNLAKLYLENKLDGHVRLIKTYENIKKIGFVKVTKSIMTKRQNSYYADLARGKGTLRKFALFKLGVFMTELEEISSGR